MQVTEFKEIRTVRQPRCEVCGGKGKPLHSGLNDVVFGTPGEWNLSQCSNSACKLVWLDPRPTEEDIGRAYEKYYTHNDNSQSRTLTSRIFFTLLGLENTRKRLDCFFLNELKPGRLLEIGFGDARRMRQFVELGWHVVGQELDPVALSNARRKGFEVYQGELTQLGLEPNQFDAIVGSHVIEHMRNPLAQLNECHRLLKRGGRLVILTPNTASYGHRKFGRDWRGNEPPRHLHLFAPGNMRKLLDRTGFEHIKIETTPARATGMYLGCIDIATSNNCSPPLTRLLGRSASAATYTILSRIHHLFDPLVADEMIATAWDQTPKPG